MAEIKLYGVIGDGVNTKDVFKALLAKVDPTEDLVIRIDSEGGSVFDGFAIHDAIASHAGKTRAIVESQAFSIASFIATACDEVEITPNGYFMLHNPAVDISGADDDELSSRAELMTKLKDTMIAAYADRMRKSTEEVQAIMKRETYFDAEQCLASGLADRVLSKAKPSACVSENMPHRVYAALRSGGEKREPEQRETPDMSETQKPVAATVSEIKSAFPKSKADFVLKCIERQMPMASVAAAAAEEMMEENEALRAENEELTARISAMEEEATAKSKAMEEEEEARAKAEEDEEEESRAAAKLRPGSKPIARVAGASGSKPTASQRWHAAVQQYVQAGQPKHKAVALANRNNPGLRQKYVEEVNS
jgi:ATP-dependent protease ClpP protease subunit